LYILLYCGFLESNSLMRAKSQLSRKKLKLSQIKKPFEAQHLRHQIFLL